MAVCGLICGCSEAARPTAKAISLKPRVNVAHPEIRTIHRTIAQPGKIDPYEQTAMYSKIAGFVQKWYVDIGDHVKKDDLLVELLVPELAEEHKQKNRRGRGEKGHGHSSGNASARC